MICTHCKIDRPLDQYQTYWHKNHNKFHTRRTCTPCMREGSRNYKRRIKEQKQQMIELPQQEKIIQPEVFITPVNTKECFSCEEIKPLTDFYHSQRGTPFKNCKECHKINYKKAVVENNKDKGGSERVPYYPNTYVDNYQKEQTFWVMKLMGWTYNDNGVWSREGIKDKNKVWTNIDETNKRKKNGNRSGGRKRLSIHNKVDDVIRDYRNGNDFFDLAHIYNCSHTTIRKLIKDYYDGKKP